MSQEDLFLSTLSDWMETAIHRSFHGMIRHIRESDLSFSQINTLFRLYHRGPGSVNDLAQHLGVTKAAVSQLLDSLIASGLVVRSEDPQDRRKRLIALTEKGEVLVKKSMTTRHAWLADLAEGLSDDEKAQILPVIQLLNQRVHDFNGDLHPPCKHGKQSKSMV